MTILDDIIAEKRKEVAELKKTYVPGEKFKNRAAKTLYEMFMESDHMNILAEIKRASPSKGIINPDVDPPAQARQYAEYGAGGISVLTDQPFFKGTMEDLLAVRESVQVPLLNKDFIIDPIQIDRAKDHGANVILLIVAALTKKELHDLYQYATNQQLEVLVEVHNEEEMDVAKELGAKIIGINNRNLKTFEVDLAITERLADKVDASETLIISESGIVNTADVDRVKKAGGRAILVGETMMRSGNLEDTFNQLRIPL